MSKSPARPQTLGELRQSEYQVLPVKEEMRKNHVRHDAFEVIERVPALPKAA